MKEYIEWLQRMIEQTREDKDLQREHWAFCQSLKKVRELAFHQCDVSGRSEQLVICNKCGGTNLYQHTKLLDKCYDCGNIQDY